MLKFFLNTQTKSYLRGLEKDFGESTNAIRIELNRFENAGLLKSEFVGNRKFFQANTKHPLFNDINNILKKFVGIDQIIERVTSKIGNLETAYLTGDFAIGKDSKIIDLLLIGNNLDNKFIDGLIEKAEELIERKIKYLILTSNQMDDFFHDKPALLIWKADQQ
jgi:hypothetical protein